MVSEILNGAFKLEVRKSNSSRWACKQQRPGSGTEALAEQEGAGGLVNMEQFPFSGLKCGDLGRGGRCRNSSSPILAQSALPSRSCSCQNLQQMGEDAKVGDVFQHQGICGDENKISSSLFALVLISKEVSCCFPAILPFP